MSISNKNQSGIAHLMIIIGLVVIAVIAAVAWKVSSSKSTTTVASKAVQSACEKEINDKNFCKFAASFTLNTSYEATITTVDTAGATSSMTMQSDTKNNSSIVSRADGKETAAYVSLDGDTYFKDESTGSWTKIAGDKTKPTVTSPTSDIKIDTTDLTAKNTTTYKYLSKEKCGSLNCFKYQIVDTAATGTTQYIWFDDKNYQMQRWYSKDANGSTDMSFTYKSIKISAPSPVSDTSASDAAALQAAQAAAAALNSAASNTDTTTTDTTSTDTTQ